jgi:uncharacterized alkaline shock family protein YloU
MKAANETKKVEQETAQNTALLEGSEMGDVKIHENVIAALVRQAALEQEGVSRLAGSALVDDIANLVGSRRMQSRAISVELGEDSRVGIEIKLNLIFGYRIPEVADRVQKAIISSVEEITGMTVMRVNVLIQEIEDPIVESDDDVDAAVDTALPIN